MPAFAGMATPITNAPSKPRQIGKARRAAVHMNAIELRAAAELRKDLAGIEQALLIEGAFQALLLVQVDFTEHRVHEIALFDADAVLAGEHAADLDAKPQDRRAEGFGPLEFAWAVGVIEDERVQVAVARVEDIGAAQAVFLLHGFHAVQDRADLFARDCAVHAVIVGRNAADGGKSRLAAGPEQEALVLRSARLAASGAMRGGDLLDRRDEV